MNPSSKSDAIDHQRTDDDRLMIRLQEGDQSAFEELVARNQGPLIGFFLRNTRDRHLAEDLAQETLIKIYQQSWDYLPLGRFTGWMYRIARNLLIDNVRRRSHDALVKAIKGHDENEHDAMARIAGEFASPEDKAKLNEIAAIIDDLLAEIPEDQRQTFTLHYYSGLKLAEVAEVMESTVPTTKSRVRLAREKLHEKLKRRGVTGDEFCSVSPGSN